jgi:hypothetical protein
MIHSAGMGVTLTLIAAQADGRLSHYEGLSGNVREAVLDSVLAPAPAADDVVARPGPGSRSAAVHAVALKSLMRDGVRSLTSGERTLLGEWLDRVAAEDSAVADAATAGSAGSEAGRAGPGAGSARRP